MEELAKLFNLFKLNLFLIPTLTHADSLPNLEIDLTYSVELNKIDLRECREKGI
jgi:hypothetical protein